MAARAGVPPEEYAKFMPGTQFLTPEEALKRFEPKDTLESLYGSGKVADEFNVANKVYAQPQPVADVHRRVAVEGGAREAAPRSGGREAAHAETRSPCAAPGRGRSRSCPPRRRRAAGRAVVRRCRSLVWCVVSYVPFVWHPMVRVTDPGERRLACTPRHAGRARRVRRARTPSSQRAAGGRPRATRGQPVFLPRAARGGARAVHRLHHAARAPPTSRGCTRACGTASR